MSEGKPGGVNVRTAVIVIIAGLLTGGAFTWYFGGPRSDAAATEPGPVAGEPRRPLEDIVADQDAEAPAQTNDDDSPLADQEAAPADESADARLETPSSTQQIPELERPSDEDGKVIHETQNRQEQEGIEEYVELDEELYVRLSAQLAIAASALRDREDAKEILQDYTATLLTKHRVDPQDFYEYTQWVASDNDRAHEMGEKILREAEKHTKERISVSAVPGLDPAPVAPPEE